MFNKKKIGMLPLLMIPYVFIILVVIAAVGITLNIQISNSNTEQSIKKYEDIFSQASLQLDSTIQDLRFSAARIITSGSLLTSINTYFSDDYDDSTMQLKPLIVNDLSDTIGFANNIEKAFIHINGTNFIADYASSPNSNRFDDNDVDYLLEYKNIIGDKGYAIINNYSIGTSSSSYLEDNYTVLLTSYNDTLTSKNKGILGFIVNQEDVYSVFDDTFSNDDEYVGILDSNNNLLYYNHSDELFTMPELLSLGADSSGQVISIDDSEYLYINYYNEATITNIIALIPTRLLNNNIEFQKTLINIALIAFVLGVILSLVILYIYTGSFKNLIHSMSQVSEGNLHLVNSSPPVRELDELMVSHNEMVTRISQLMDKIRKKEEEKRQADLKILQSQINPHFTYNTLDSIFWVAKMQNADTTAEMISKFSNLLRLATTGDVNYVPVSQELEQLSYYFDILKLRYNSLVTINFDTDEDTLNKGTLKLILQPIVENCFEHGFSLNDSSSRIDVKSYIEDDILYFKVVDNGRGMRADNTQLPSQSRRSHKLSKGIGLKNIDDRIKQKFGDKYGVSIESEKGVGTTVILTQPAIIFNMERQDDTTDDSRR